MRVAGDGVSQLDSGEVMSEGRRENRCAAPCGVDVKPKAGLLAELSDLRQGIDYTGRGGSGVGHNHERQEPIGTILRHAFSELIDVHFELAVSRDLSEIPPPDSGHMRDLVEAEVSFLSEIDGWLAGKMAKAEFAIAREGVSQCDDDRRKICLHTTAGKCCDGMVRQSEFTGEPSERVSLNFIGSGRGSPVCQLRVVHRDERICDNRGQGDAGIEQAEVARVGNLHLPFPQHSFRICDDIFEKIGLLEVIARRQVSPDLFRGHGGKDGARGDGGLQSSRIHLGFDR